MIDLEYYKIIAGDETELSPKGFEFKITLRDLIADIEREQKETESKTATNASYASPASSGVQTAGQYIPNLKNIWQVRQIRCGNDNITMVADFTIPNDEIWFVDTDGHTQKFKMVQTP